MWGTWMTSRYSTARSRMLKSIGYMDSRRGFGSCIRSRNRCNLSATLRELPPRPKGSERCPQRGKILQAGGHEFSLEVGMDGRACCARRKVVGVGTHEDPGASECGDLQLTAELKALLEVH